MVFEISSTEVNLFVQQNIINDDAKEMLSGAWFIQFREEIKVII
ncbi:MAG: hypothetical protein WCQ95_08225 [Bacteroidota bacterium]